MSQFVTRDLGDEINQFINNDVLLGTQVTKSESDKYLKCCCQSDARGVLDASCAPYQHYCQLRINTSNTVALAPNTTEYCYRSECTTVLPLPLLLPIQRDQHY